jgi:hypothetical protein
LVLDELDRELSLKLDKMLGHYVYYPGILSKHEWSALPPVSPMPEMPFGGTAACSALVKPFVSEFIPERYTPCGTQENSCRLAEDSIAWQVLLLSPTPIGSLWLSEYHGQSFA